jgi:flagellar biosynthetic protein FliR
MDWLNQLNFEKFLLFTLVLTRVSGLVMTAPIYGDRQVPRQVRVFLALSLALLVMPSQWNVAVNYPGSIISYLVIIGGELVVGVFLGLGITLLFHGMEMAGEIIGQLAGLMIASTYDPSMDTDTPLISQFFYLISLSIFVCIGGHRLVMAGLLDTFQTIPPGNGLFNPSMTEGFVTLLVQSFSLAIRTAAPTAIALLLATLVIGLIGRTVPQLNVLMIGFGLNSLVAFGVLMFTLGVLAFTFQDQVEPALDTLLDSLHTTFRGGWLT